MAAHAHPLPDGFYLPIQQQSPSTPCPSDPSTTSHSRSLASQRYPESATPHRRRLQLRNAGFRAPLIPSRRVSPFFGISISPPDYSSQSSTPNNENTLRPDEKHSSRRRHSNPLNILQEINNSSRRRRDSPRPHVSSIFPSAPASAELNLQDQNIRPGLYAIKSGTAATMLKSKESTLYEKTPSPLISPLAKHLKGRKKSKINLRSTSFEASKYIEHLESELVSLNAKLDSQSSPGSSKAQASKIRALGKQLESLRDEVTDWEGKFEERVDDAVFQRTQFDTSLKLKLKELEQDIEIKDTSIRELECDLEVTRTKLMETEQLEVSLNHRVDVLTNLLAQSPTRLDFPSSSSTPSVGETSRPPSRPRSWVIPRLPTSPGLGQYPFPQSNSSGRNSHNRERSESIMEDGEETQLPPVFDPSSQLGLEHPHPAASLTSSNNATLSNSENTSSRPTSMIPVSSTGASWGLPFPPDDVKASGKPRKMRRFAPGSTSLKPLVLPTAAALPQSLPASAPVESTYQTPFRHTSRDSLDPTTEFLSRESTSPPGSTPTRPFRQRSVPIVPDSDLQSLDAWADTMQMGRPRLRDLSMSSQITDEVSLRSDCSPPTRNLQVELEEAQENEPSTSSPVMSPASDDTGANTVRVSRITSPRPNLDAILVQSPVPAFSSPRRPCPALNLADSPLAVRRIRSYQDLHRKSLRSMHGMPMTSVGVFSRVSSLIASIRQQPLAIARRIVANAWSRGLARFGGLGWWLIGLVFGQKGRDRLDRHGTFATGEDSRDSACEPPWEYADHDLDLESQSPSPLYSRTSRLKRQFMSESSEYGGFGGNQAQEQHHSESTPKLHRARPETAAAPPPRLDKTNRDCPDCVEPPTKNSLKLWAKFALTLVLAVGVAVLEGPGAILNEKPTYSKSPSPEQERRPPGHGEASQRERPGRNQRSGMDRPRSDESAQDSPPDGHWAWDDTFSKTLTPADFK